MAAIKRFFEKKKLELKFKKAGEGHKLTDDTRGRGGAAAGPSSSPRRDPTYDARMAGQAALQRMNQPKPGTIIERSVLFSTLCERENDFVFLASLKTETFVRRSPLSISFIE